MFSRLHGRIVGLALAGAIALAAGTGGGAVARAQATPFVQSILLGAGDDADLRAFYTARAFAPFWTGRDQAARRSALLAALAGVEDHGLPAARYDAAGLKAALRQAHSVGDLGRLEIALTRAFLTYARDVQSGLLTPAKLDPTMVRVVAHEPPASLLARFEAAEPRAFLRSLPPQWPEYAALMREKIRLQDLIAQGGYGAPIPEDKLQPGDEGAAVIALRDRLVRLGYMARSASRSYDARLTAAVVRFQRDHGLNADGVAGASTLAEVNVPAEARLKSVVVAMERLRWMAGTDRGQTHIWVNEPDFTAKIIQRGKVIFRTRAVIGKNAADTHSPEFSDFMEYMVVNPSWGVPRSITVGEYLPLLQQDPTAVAHLQIVDDAGRIVPREAVNFAAYSAQSFPFDLRQPPSDGNALGKVKFMFPNPYNIYLHDTPAKDLFAKETRAFSHGCIRLADPFDFAHALLAMQTDDPDGTFRAALNSGKETTITLAHPLPVHLVYFTAWPDADGQIAWRRDVYGRDALIAEALVAAGVALDGVQG